MAAGILLALLTSVAWAFGNVLIQQSGQRLGAARAMLWALLTGGAAAGLLSLLLDVRAAPFTGAVAGWTVAAAAGGVLAYVCLFHAFTHTPLSLAVPVVSSWSLVSALLSFVAFGERPGALPLVGAALVFAGVVLVALAGATGASPGPDVVPAGGAPPARARRGSLLVAFGSAVGFGVMVPSLARVSPALGEFGATAVIYGLGILLGLPLALLFRTPLGPPSRALWPLILGTGVAETVGFVCVAYARRFAPMSVVTPVSSLAAALTVLYAWVALRERPRPLAMAGAALACAGIVVLSA